MANPNTPQTTTPKQPPSQTQTTQPTNQPTKHNLNKLTNPQILNLQTETAPATKSANKTKNKL
ncbi:hypothetical protein [Candidatus Bathycorpusculum sp.]|uniref:hypothetical protein n=1 Tax=Candidatus Bathycorpusculum sp. TaxID=2994959 RepID=UPI002830BF79|nr:hypothetical protein [Candidatus Termitimicrobium sp.]MCL2432305.1 hypothetical protein [Candidatus Termitimicrobium sp.]